MRRGPAWLLAALLVGGAAAPAHAQTSTTGPEGQTLIVSKSTGLAPAGETVTVEGTGFDETKGIYVAFCVDNGPAARPTPCGGGVDSSGSLGASHWVSSNPPSYGDGLAVPYRDGGSFSVTLHLAARIGEVDCTERACAVVTRADHTRGADRSQDVRVPVTFSATANPVPWRAVIGGAAVAVLLGLAVVALLRRRRRAAR